MDTTKEYPYKASKMNFTVIETLSTPIPSMYVETNILTCSLHVDKYYNNRMSQTLSLEYMTILSLPNRDNGSIYSYHQID